MYMYIPIQIVVLSSDFLLFSHHCAGLGIPILHHLPQFAHIPGRQKPEIPCQHRCCVIDNIHIQSCSILLAGIPGLHLICGDT